MRENGPVNGKNRIFHWWTWGWWPEAGSDRRRPFQGLLLIALSRLNQRIALRRKQYGRAKRGIEKEIFGSVVYP
jgi:hypothetical protein